MHNLRILQAWLHAHQFHRGVLVKPQEERVNAWLPGCTVKTFPGSVRQGLFLYSGICAAMFSATAIRPVTVGLFFPQLATPRQFIAGRLVLGSDDVNAVDNNLVCFGQPRSLSIVIANVYAQITR